MSNQVATDLKAARAELVTRGWSQGALENAHGQLCAVGALNLACCGASMPAVLRNPDWDRRNAASTVLKQHLPKGGDIVVFNDAPTTTQQDVLNLFEKALAELGAL